MCYFPSVLFLSVRDSSLPMQGGFTTCRHYLCHYHTVYTVYISSLRTSWDWGQRSELQSSASIFRYNIFLLFYLRCVSQSPAVEAWRLCNLGALTLTALSNLSCDLETGDCSRCLPPTCTSISFTFRKGGGE